MRRLAGASADTIAEKFKLKRDAVYRHMQNHVTADDRSSMMADVPLKELADAAAAEGVSLIDYLTIVRSTVVSQMLGAASINDRSGTAALAGRAVDVLKEIGKLTGEMLRTAPMQHVTHNTAIFMASPAFAQLEQMLLTRLAPFPAALQAVLAGLEDLEGQSAGSAAPALSGPILEGSYA